MGVQRIRALGDARCPISLVTQLGRTGDTGRMAGHAGSVIDFLALVIRSARRIRGRDDGIHHGGRGRCGLDRFDGADGQFTDRLDALGNSLGIHRGFDGLGRLAADHLRDDKKNHRQHHQRGDQARERFQK